MGKSRDELRAEAEAALSAGVPVKRLPAGPKPDPVFAKKARSDRGMTIGQKSGAGHGRHPSISKRGDDSKPPTPVLSADANAKTKKRKERRRRQKMAAGRVKFATWSQS